MNRDRDRERDGLDLIWTTSSEMEKRLCQQEKGDFISKYKDKLGDLVQVVGIVKFIYPQLRDNIKFNIKDPRHASGTPSDAIKECIRKINSIIENIQINGGNVYTLGIIDVTTREACYIYKASQLLKNDIPAMIKTETDELHSFVEQGTIETDTAIEQLNAEAGAAINQLIVQSYSNESLVPVSGTEGVLTISRQGVNNIVIETPNNQITVRQDTLLQELQGLQFNITVNNYNITTPATPQPESSVSTDDSYAILQEVLEKLSTEIVTDILNYLESIRTNHERIDIMLISTINFAYKVILHLVKFIWIVNNYYGFIGRAGGIIWNIFKVLLSCIGYIFGKLLSSYVGRLFLIFLYLWFAWTAPDCNKVIFRCVWLLGKIPIVGIRAVSYEVGQDILNYILFNINLQYNALLAPLYAYYSLVASNLRLYVQPVVVTTVEALQQVIYNCGYLPMLFWKNNVDIIQEQVVLNPIAVPNITYDTTNLFLVLSTLTTTMIVNSNQVVPSNIPPQVLEISGINSSAINTTFNQVRERMGRDDGLIASDVIKLYLDNLNTHIQSSEGTRRSVSSYFRSNGVAAEDIRLNTNMGLIINNATSVNQLATLHLTSLTVDSSIQFAELLRRSQQSNTELNRVVTTILEPTFTDRMIQSVLVMLYPLQYIPWPIVSTGGTPFLPPSDTNGMALGSQAGPAVTHSFGNVYENIIGFFSNLLNPSQSDGKSALFNSLDQGRELIYQPKSMIELLYTEAVGYLYNKYSNPNRELEYRENNIEFNNSGPFIEEIHDNEGLGYFGQPTTIETPSSTPRVSQPTGYLQGIQDLILLPGGKGSRRKVTKKKKTRGRSSKRNHKNHSAYKSRKHKKRSFRKSKKYLH
jgi:hypothetical protein